MGLLFDVIQLELGKTMTPVFSAIHGLFYTGATWFSALFMGVFSAPLLAVYLNGPEFLTLGFWGGGSPVEICNRLSTISPEYWVTRTPECIEIISSRFQAFVFSLSSTFWCVILLALVRTAFHSLRARAPQIVKLLAGSLVSLGLFPLARLWRRSRSSATISLKRLDPNVSPSSSPG